MKSIRFAIIVCSMFLSVNMFSQTLSLSPDRLQAVDVTVTEENQGVDKVIKVVKNPLVKEVDEPTYVRIKGLDFTNGVIEVKVMSRLLKEAPTFSRGFIGVAFRINEDNTKYECIYLRPTNGRADEQVRRNHSIQYFSYPDYKFSRLRKESPETYESYADMGLDEWIVMRIEVDGDKCKLYLYDNKHPSLVVNDLKLGHNKQGAIALWVDVGTEGFFKDLKVIEK